MSRLLDVPHPGGYQGNLPVRDRLPYPHKPVLPGTLYACQVPEHPLADGAVPMIAFSVECQGCPVAFAAVVLRNPSMRMLIAAGSLGSPKRPAVDVFRSALPDVNHPIRIAVERALAEQGRPEPPPWAT